MLKLPRDFYDRDTTLVARELLGRHLAHVVDGVTRIGRIVETEAYLGAHDLASHSSKGITPRTRLMYGPPGFAYVYRIYGIHHCMNVVTEAEGNGAAVLIRALEPQAGVEGRTQGPGLLCKAMDIDMRCNGLDLLGEKLFLMHGATPPEAVVERPRIGVAYAGPDWAERPLRFYLRGNPWISRS